MPEFHAGVIVGRIVCSQMTRTAILYPGLLAAGTALVRGRICSSRRRRWRASAPARRPSTSRGRRAHRQEGGLATKSAQNLPRGLCSAMEGAFQPVTPPTVPRATHAGRGHLYNDVKPFPELGGCAFRNVFAYFTEIAPAGAPLPWKCLFGSAPAGAFLLVQCIMSPQSRAPRGECVPLQS